MIKNLVYIILFSSAVLFSANLNNNKLSLLYGDGVINLNIQEVESSRAIFEQKNIKSEDYSIKKRSHKRRRKIRRPREGR